MALHKLGLYQTCTTVCYRVVTARCCQVRKGRVEKGRLRAREWRVHPLSARDKPFLVWVAAPVILLRTREHDRELQNVDSLQPFTLAYSELYEG